VPPAGPRPGKHGCARRVGPATSRLSCCDHRRPTRGWHVLATSVKPRKRRARVCPRACALHPVRPAAAWHSTVLRASHAETPASSVLAQLRASAHRRPPHTIRACLLGCAHVVACRALQDAAPSAAARRAGEWRLRTEVAQARAQTRAQQLWVARPKPHRKLTVWMLLHRRLLGQKSS
jgi:hypothetical protein